MRPTPPEIFRLGGTATRRLLRNLVFDAEAATMVEYGFMLGLIAVVLILTVGQIGTGAAAKFALVVVGFQGTP